MIATKAERLQAQRTYRERLSRLLPGISVDVWFDPKRYPATVMNCQLWFDATFPEGVSDAVVEDERPVREALAPQGGAVIGAIETVFGQSLQGVEGQGPILLLSLPSPFSKDADQYGRWMTDAERTAFAAANDGRDPFTDEAWINTRWAGVRYIFRGKVMLP